MATGPTAGPRGVGVVTFLAPGAAILAAGVGLPLLLLLHVLRLRRLPQRVASTLLWRRSVKDLEANVPFQRLRFSLLFILQVLALLCAAFAAGQPVLSTMDTDRALVVVLDARARMNARTSASTSPDAPAPTRFDLARAKAREILKSRIGNSESSCQLVLARATPALMAGGSARAVIDALESAQPTDEPGDLAEAVRLAEQLSPEGEIVVVDDLAILDDPRSAAAAADNTGITALAVERSLEEPGSVDVLITAINSGAEPLETPLTITQNGSASAARSLHLPAAGPDGPGRATVLARVPWLPGALLEARLSRPDLLELDDHAAMRVAPRAPVRVAFLGGPSPLLSLLELVDGAAVISLPCDSSAESLSGFDLVAADGCEPARAAGVKSPPSLVFAWPAGAAPESAEGVRAVSSASGRAHPILRGVPPIVLDTARPTKGAAAAIPDGATILFEDGSSPLAYADPRGTTLRFLFPLTACEWTADPSWVMTMQNGVQWLLGEETGAVGEALHTGRTGRVTVLAPDGGRRRVEVPPQSHAGMITVTAPGGASIEEPVSLLDEAQSDLRAGAAGARTPGGSAAAVRRDTRVRQLWPWFAAAAMLLLLGEWFVYTAKSRTA